MTEIGAVNVTHWVARAVRPSNGISPKKITPGKGASPFILPYLRLTIENCRLVCGSLYITRLTFVPLDRKGKNPSILLLGVSYRH